MSNIAGRYSLGVVFIIALCLCLTLPRTAHAAAGSLDNQRTTIWSTTGTSTVPISSTNPPTKTTTLPGEELREGTAHIVFSAQGLADKDSGPFGTSDAYFKVYKELANGYWSFVHKSERIENNLNPKWEPFSMTILKEDNVRKVKVEVYDHDWPDFDDEMGTFIAPMRQLKQGATFKLNSIPFQSKLISTSGTLRVENFYLDD